MKESIVQIGSGRYRYHYDPDTKATVYDGPVGDAPQITEDEFLKEMAYDDLKKQYFPGDHGVFESWSPELREFFMKNIADPIEIQKEAGWDTTINDWMFPPNYLLRVRTPPDPQRYGDQGISVFDFHIRSPRRQGTPSGSDDGMSIVVAQPSIHRYQWLFNNKLNKKVKGDKSEAMAEFEQAIHKYLTDLPPAEKWDDMGCPDLGLAASEWAKKHDLPTKPEYERKMGGRDVGYYMKKTGEVVVPNLWV